MLRHMRAYVILTLISVSMALSLLPAGAGADEGAGTLGAAFLTIPVGATATTVPGVVAGMRPDASMMFVNPAYLAQLGHTEVYLTRANWLDDLSMSALGVALPIPFELNWSLGSRLLYSGGLQGYNSAGEIVAEESYYGLGFTSTLSRRFPGIGLGIGLGATYVREHLPAQNGTGVFYTMGLSYERSGHRVDFTARDIGGALRFPGREYPIDSRYSFGYGRSFRRAWGVLDLGAELTFARSRASRFQLGASYAANAFLTLRSSVDHMLSAPANAQMPVTAGFGVHVGNLTLDYAYASREYFASTHTVSFTYAFDRMGARQSSSATKPSRMRPRAGNSVVSPSKRATTEASEKGNAVSQPSGPGTPAQKAAQAPVTYLVIAGVHSRVESAEAEARALRLLKVPADIVSVGRRSTVVVGRYSSRAKAESAVQKFRKKGHVFTIVSE